MRDERAQEDVITSGQPRGVEIGLSWNSPPWACKSQFEGMMKTRLGSISSRSLMRSTGIAV